MKYLKPYKLIFESFTEDDIKQVFEPYINWNLLEDVKEMAMPDLDDGLKLFIEVYYENIEIFFRSFDGVNHIEDNWLSEEYFNKLTEGPYEFEPVNKNKIYYRFWFSSDSGYTGDQSKELSLRVKDAFPKINLKEIKISSLLENLSENIKDDIKDIFLSEIKDIDERYNIEIYDFNDVLGSKIEDKIVVEISKWDSIITSTMLGRRSFKLDEIEDGVHRILNYMGDTGYKNTYIEAKYRALDDWTRLFMKEGKYTTHKLGPFENRFKSKISRIKITFKK